MRRLPAFALAAALALPPCHPALAQDAPAPAVASAPLTVAAPIRFLLTFDDGPSAAELRNSTIQVLDTLAANKVQPGAKAIFFTQTRASNAGASVLGRQLMRREFSEGHLLAFHTATSGHANHRKLDPDQLEQALADGAADLSAITGTAPTLVRPPFWNFDARTLAAYHRHGYQMILTDLSANDGKIWGVNFSWHKRSNMLAQLSKVRQRWRDGAMPLVDGSHPVVVTFHDVNNYTARHLEEYMEILLDVARELEMPTAATPFYDERGAMERAALATSVKDAASAPDLPGFWNWLWK